MSQYARSSEMWPSSSTTKISTASITMIVGLADGSAPRKLSDDEEVSGEIKEIVFLPSNKCEPK